MQINVILIIITLYLHTLNWDAVFYLFWVKDNEMNVYDENDQKECFLNYKYFFDFVLTMMILLMANTLLIEIESFIIVIYMWIERYSD